MDKDKLSEWEKKLSKEIAESIIKHPAMDVVAASSILALSNILVIFAIVMTGKEQALDVISGAVNRAFNTYEKDPKIQSFVESLEQRFKEGTETKGKESGQ